MLKPNVFRIKNSLFSFNGLSNFPASFSNGEIPASAAIVNTPPTTSSKPEPTTAEQLPCPDGFTTLAEGWCFLVVQETKTWDNAEAHCQTFGQHVQFSRLGNTGGRHFPFQNLPLLLFCCIFRRWDQITADDNQDTL